MHLTLQPGEERPWLTDNQLPVAISMRWIKHFEENFALIMSTETSRYTVSPMPKGAVRDPAQCAVWLNTGWIAMASMK